MDDLLLAEISPTGISDSFRHMKEFFKNHNLSILVQHIKSSPGENIWEIHKEDLESCRAVRLGYEDSKPIVKNWAALPSLVRELQVCDTLMREDGQYWPRLLLQDSIRELIVKSSRDHDIRNAAYIICNDSIGRVMASLLTNLGHRRVFMVSQNERFLKNEIPIIQRFFLGIEIQGVLAEQLTMQADRASLLVNCVDLSGEQQMLNDIVYFNFMQQGGLVLDASFNNSKPSLLVEEAERAHLKSIEPALISATYDFGLIHKLGLSQLTTFQEYLDSWREFLKSES